MDLNDFLGPKPIVIDLQAEDRWQAIDELIAALVTHHKIKLEHKEAISESVKKRERAMTTGIGFGIGIPHASTDLVSEVVGAIGRLSKGVQFEALDNVPVKRVLLSSYRRANSKNIFTLWPLLPSCSIKKIFAMGLGYKSNRCQHPRPNL